MKKALLLIGIACLFVCTGCGNGEKTQEAAQEEMKEETGAVQKDVTQEKEAAKSATAEAEKAVDTAKEKTRETVETAKQKTRETAESAQQKAGAIGVITMKNEKAFAQHRMGIVEFDHKAHAADYGLSCGKCHHDENGKPLNNLSYDDAVQSCYACHDKNGRPQREEGMSQEQWTEKQLKYYYGAIHENCMGCHKETKGPTRCTECHPRPQG